MKSQLAILMAKHGATPVVPDEDLLRSHEGDPRQAAGISHLPPGSPALFIAFRRPRLNEQGMNVGEVFSAAACSIDSRRAFDELVVDLRKAFMKDMRTERASALEMDCIFFPGNGAQGHVPGLNDLMPTVFTFAAGNNSPLDNSRKARRTKFDAKASDEELPCEDLTPVDQKLSKGGQSLSRANSRWNRTGNKPR